MYDIAGSMNISKSTQFLSKDVTSAFLEGFPAEWSQIICKHEHSDQNCGLIDAAKAAAIGTWVQYSCFC